MIRRWPPKYALALGAGVFAASLLTPLRSPWELGPDEYVVLFGREPFVVLLALASGVTTVLARRTAWPLNVVALLSWLSYSMWPTMVMASFNAGLRLERRSLGAVQVAVSLVAVVVPILFGSFHLIDGIRFALVMAALLILLPYTAGAWIRTRQRLIDELHARNATLATQARTQERTRIAREMHDVVAHRVAIIVLHAGGLELAAPDENTAREAALIRTTGREALDELRHLLGVLRAPGERPEQPLLDSLGRLVEQTRVAGVPVQLKVEGDVGGLPGTVERSVYRLVQEGLTNVVKHAPGAHTEVLLHKEPSYLDVSVRSGPRTRKSAGAESLPSSGLGLIGLRERIDLIGGRFHAAPLPDGGFQVSARLPTNGDVLQLPGEDVRRAV